MPLDFLEDETDPTKSAGVKKEQGSNLDFLEDENPQLDRATTNVELTKDVDPDKEAENIKLSRESGAPVELVRAQPDSIKYNLEKPDMRAMAINSPKTAEYYGDFDSASVSKGDHGNLVHVESTWSKVKKSYRVGQQNVKSGELHSQQMLNVLLGRSDEALDANINQLMSGRLRSPEDANFFETSLTAATEQLPLLGNLLKAGHTTGLGYGATGAAGALLLGQAGPQIAAPEELITVPGAFATMYAAGVKVGSIEAIFKQEGGLAFEEIKTFKDENGQVIDPRIAAVASVGIGGVNAGLEFVALKTLAKTIPGGEALLGKITLGMAEKALQNPSIRQALLKVAGKYATAVSAEGLTEMAQEAINILGGEFAKSISESTEGTFFKAVDAEEAGSRIIESGIEGAAATLLLGAPGSVTSGYLDVQDARKAKAVQLIDTMTKATEAEAFHNNIVEFNEAVNTSETKQRSPEMMAVYLEKLGVEDDVFLTPEGAEEMLQSEGGVSVFERLGIDPVEAQEAVNTGQDIKIPVAQIHASLEPEEFTAMSSDLKAAPSAMSKREADAVDVEAEVKELVKRHEEVTSDREPFQAELSRISQEIQAAGFNKEYADQVLTAVEGFSDRMALIGQDRVAFLKKYKVKRESFEQFEARKGRRAGTTIVDQPQAQQQLEQAAEATKQSPEFQQFFEGSQVVDEAGEPLVVYHGTGAVFEEFDIERAGRSDRGDFGKALYFHRNPTNASRYAQAAINLTEQPNVIPTYVSIKNPLIFNSEKDFDEHRARVSESDEAYFSLTPEQKAQAIKDLGYDGVIDNTYGQYAVFEPTQIKSIHSEAFDTSDPRILAQQDLPSPDVMAETIAIDESLPELTDINAQITSQSPLDSKGHRASRDTAIELIGLTENDNPGQPRMLYRAAKVTDKDFGAEGVLAYNRGYKTTDGPSGASMQGIYWSTSLKGTIKYAQTEKGGKKSPGKVEIHAVPVANMPDEVIALNATGPGDISSAQFAFPGDVNLDAISIKPLTEVLESGTFVLRRNIPDADISEQRRDQRAAPGGLDRGDPGQRRFQEFEPRGPREGIQLPEGYRPGGEADVRARGAESLRVGDTVHDMPDGSIMPGEEHEGSVEGSERPATQADVTNYLEGFTLYQDLEQPVPTFFSTLQKELASDKFAGKGTGNSYASTIRGWIKKGMLKAEEVEWVGLLDYLDGLGKQKVSREEVLTFVEENGVQIEETLLAGEIPEGSFSEEGFDTDIRELDRQFTGEEEEDFDQETAEVEVTYEDRNTGKSFIVRGSDFAGNWSLYDEDDNFIKGELDSEKQAVDIIDDIIREDVAETNRQTFAEARAEGPTKFAEYQLPGGENYKELLLRLPEITSERFKISKVGDVWVVKSDGKVVGKGTNLRDLRQSFGLPQGATSRDASNFTSSHFDDPNILAHIRFNERTDSEGNKVLFIEEIQSDWHQAGRKKGYKTGKLPEGYEIKEVFKSEKGDKGFRVINPNGGVLSGVYDTEQEAIDSFNTRSEAGVPDAPFKKTWPQLALKRMVRYAAENGFDKIAWTTGEQQAERYDLSKQVSRIQVASHEKGYFVNAFGLSGERAIDKGPISGEELSALIGKDLADKAITDISNVDPTQPQEVNYSGLDLKVGGEGQKGFYDKILPSAANKLFNKKTFGNVKVEETEIEVAKDLGLQVLRDGDTFVILAEDGKFWKSDSGENGFFTNGIDNADHFQNKEAAAKVKGTIEKEGKGVGPVPSITITPELKAMALEEGLPLFQEEGRPKDPRGVLQIFNERYLVTLFDRANLSTLLHETGHIFMEEMGSIVAAGQAPDEMVEDYNTLVNWVGGTPGAALSIDQKEKLARGFEAYLREGKAPSVKMRAAFERFKKWLTNVYKSVKDLNVDLNDDVRQVFDRVLAVDQEVAQSAALDDMLILSKEEMDALGVVTDDRLFMKRLVDDAHKEAERKMTKDRNSDRKSKMKGWKKEATEEVEKMPVYMAIKDARTTEALSARTIDQKYGSFVLNSMPARTTKKEGGVDPDWAAYKYDFDTADQLIQAMIQAPPAKDAIDEIVAQKSLAHDAQYRAQDYLADTKGFGEYLFIKAKYEARTEGKPADVLPRQAFRIFAKSRLDPQPVKDAIRSDRFLSSMSKFSKEERRKLQAGKIAEAAEASEKVRINYEMAGLAVKNRREVERILKKAKRNADSKTLDPNYRENLLAIMQRFGLGTENQVPQSPETKPPLVNMLNTQGDAIDQTAFFSDWILNESNTEDFREMSMERMNEVGQMVDILVGRGRDAHSATLSDGKTKIADAANAIEAEVTTLPKKTVFKRFSLIRKLTTGMRKWFSMQDSIQFIAIALGGYQNLGKKGKKSTSDALITDRLIAAQTKDDLLNEKIYAQLEPHLNHLIRSMADMKKKYGRHVRVEGAPVPSILQRDGQDGWWTPDQILSVMLNLGNAGNMERLYNGYEDLESDTVARLMDVLSKEDWDAIQGIWDTIDSLFTEIDDTHFRMNFFHMNKTEAQPIRTKHGIYKGGYYPAKYDGSLFGIASQKVNQFTEEEALMSTTEAIFQVPAAKSGLTRARKDGVALPLKLSLSVATGHLRDATRYISHAEAIRDIDRITRSGSLVGAIQERLGKEVYEMIRPSLKYIARPVRDYPTSIDKAVDHLRGYTTPFILAWNAGVAMKQWFSTPAAWFEIGIDNYMQGFSEVFFTGSPVAQLNKMKELSPYLRQRGTSMDREIQGQFHKMSIDQKVLFFGEKSVTWEDVRNFGFWPIRVVDMFAVMPIWQGSFNKAIKENGGNIDAAVTFADTIVRKTQPSAQPMDLSKWQYGGGALRLFTMFQTFTVGKYGQRQRTHFRAWKSGKLSTGDYAWFNFLDAMLPAFGMNLLFAMLWSQDLEDEETWKDIGIGMLKYLFLTGLPIISDFFSPYGSPMDSPTKVVPEEVLRSGQSGLKFVNDMSEENLADVGWQMIRLVSLGSKVPVSRVVDKVRRGSEQEGDNPFKYLVPAPKDKRK